MDEDRNIEERLDMLMDEWDENHPLCSECGRRMFPMKEKYDLDFPFEDKWYECLNCDYSVSR